MSNGNTGAERLARKIQVACEEAMQEPMDDRPTFAEMIGVLEFHKSVWLEEWLDSMRAE